MAMTFCELVRDRARLTDDDVLRDAYAIMYHDYTRDEVERVGMPWGDFAAAHRELINRLRSLEDARDAERARRAAGAMAATDTRPVTRCTRCSLPATMHASLGPSCDDHYDDLAD